MDRRKEVRHEIEFSVQIWGVDHNSRPFAEMVRATSVSPSGAVLLDVHSRLHAGEFVDVQHEARKAPRWIVASELDRQQMSPHARRVRGFAAP